LSYVNKVLNHGFFSYQQEIDYKLLLIAFMVGDFVCLLFLIMGATEYREIFGEIKAVFHKIFHAPPTQ
jgi:hypothetical protein